MENIENLILEKLKDLNLLNINEELALSIIDRAIDAVKSYIKYEINSNLDLSKIEDIFIDIVIGEYLFIIKNCNLDESLQFEQAIKTITEGDVSITYFEDTSDSKLERFNKLINYFLDKRKLLSKYRAIRW